MRPVLSTRSRILHSSVISQATQHVSLANHTRCIVTSSTSAPQLPERSKRLSTDRHRFQMRALQRLSLSNLLRTWLIMTMSSSPRLLDSATWIIQRMLASDSILFDPDRNPLLRYIFRKTFYSQFCAGDNKAEVKETIAELQSIGYRGVILEYALEVMDGSGSGGESAANDLKTIAAWREALLTTIEMTNPGDLVAMKWSGMGVGALERLKKALPPSQSMLDAMTEVCEAAAAKEVRLLPAAEHQYAQATVDRWTLDLASKYNRIRPGYAILYNTYQAYLKSTPDTLSKHLAEALEGGFTLGIKLVRGAYLDSERRDLIHDTKDQTDLAYDGVAADALQKRYGSWLKAWDGADLAFPGINVMLATHNLVSVEKARALRNSQNEPTRRSILLSYAQLHGMADEVSCSLIQAQQDAQGTQDEPPETYKYTCWGTTKECLTYLLRRAAENRDAVSRTRVTRIAMSQEVRQRVLDTLRWR